MKTYGCSIARHTKFWRFKDYFHNRKRSKSGEIKSLMNNSTSLRTRLLKKRLKSSARLKSKREIQEDLNYLENDYEIHGILN